MQSLLDFHVPCFDPFEQEKKDESYCCPVAAAVLGTHRPCCRQTKAREIGAPRKTLIFGKEWPELAANLANGNASWRTNNITTIAFQKNGTFSLTLEGQLSVREAGGRRYQIPTTWTHVGRWRVERRELTADEKKLVGARDTNDNSANILHLQFVQGRLTNPRLGEVIDPDDKKFLAEKDREAQGIQGNVTLILDEENTLGKGKTPDEVSHLAWAVGGASNRAILDLIVTCGGAIKTESNGFVPIWKWSK